MTASTIGLGGDLFENRELTRGSPRKGRHFLVSLVVHGGVLLAASLGFVVTPPELPETETEMDMVLVRIPRDTPEPVGGQEGGAPEPEVPAAEPAPRRRAIARRTVRANVAQQAATVRRAVTRTAPTPTTVFNEVNTVDVAQTVRTQAPRVVATREARTSTVAPLQVQETTQSSEVVATETPTLRTAPTVNTASSGPRVVEAAGPVLQSDDLDYQAPTIREGQVSSVTVQGDTIGASVRVVRSGSSQYREAGAAGGGTGTGSGTGSGPGNGYGTGSGSGGGTGDGGGGGQNCNTDPVCQNYLAMIKRRVESRWVTAGDIPGGEVQVAFRLDKSGAATGVELRGADNQPLGESAVTAFRHASPFPPPPASIAYMVDSSLVATFTFGQ